MNLPCSYNIATINLNAISNDNKIQSLKTFIRSTDLDIILLQEVENPNLALTGFNILTNVDDSRRGTAIALKSHIRFSNVRRSLDTRIIAVTLRGMVTVCNVYAPSGTVNATARERLFNNTLPFFLQNCSDHYILGGDFNCVIATKDATGTSNNSLALKNLTSNLGLKDSWDVLKPSQIAYSFIRPNCSSRLDRLYVSDTLVSCLRTAEYLVTSFSDHKAFKVRCCLPDQGRPTGNGFWSMRAHVLTDENLEEFERKWNRWLREKQNFSNWIQWWIHCAKPKIKSFFRWKTNEVFRQFNVENELLYGQLRAAYENLINNPAMVPEINRIKGRMLLLQNNLSKAFERLNDKFIGGEKLTTFQLGDRAGRKKNSTISSIEHQGRRLEDSAEVEEHILDYFRQLYSAENAQLNQDFPSNRFVEPNSEANNRAMEEITTEEIFTAIQTSASRKSPGSDGIPKEFYVKAFNIIHRQLNLILNEALQGGFPEQFLDGVVVLSKKKTNLKSIKAYRPITLLNYDYKLLARILKVRLERIINENRILNSCQKCSNAKRDIFEAVHAIKDRIVELNCKRTTGKLISFDLDHAFDRVDHGYLLSVLRSMRINENLVVLIGKLMRSARSRIIINGNLSAQFPIQRSVRQGDPLSMLLFVIFLHPLLEKLLSICNHPQELVVAYADDISIILVEETKLAAIKRAFEDFGLCSGARLNLVKTTAVNIGPQRANPTDVGWTTVCDSVKILGVIYFNSLKQTIEVNWKETIRKTAYLMWLFKPRDLNIHQKVILLNSFVTSKLWYMASVLSMPNAYVAKITSQIGQFIWGRYPTRVSMDQLALPVAEGGLNLHVPKMKSKALILNRFIRGTSQTPFAASFASQLDNPPNLGGIPALHLCLKTIARELSYLPQRMIAQPTAAELHGYFRRTLTTPKIMREHPAVAWRLVWRNIRNKALTSAEKSTFYLLVNRKIPHAELLFRQSRLSSGTCQHCFSSVEDLEHKLAQCTRVRHLWNFIQSKLEAILNRRLSFSLFLIPELKNHNASSRNKALKLFIVYINFILDPDCSFTLASLEFAVSLICLN